MSTEQDRKKHEQWVDGKTSNGWEYGPELIDQESSASQPKRKEHPCLIPFKKITDEIKTPDYIQDISGMVLAR